MLPYDWVQYHDQYGEAHTDWISSVTDQASADQWAASQGVDANGNQQNMDVSYIGKEGYQTNGYTEDGQSGSTYKLNSNGPATRLGDGDPKPSTTKVDLANVEPDKDVSPAEKIATVIGAISEIAEVGLDKGKEAAEGAAKVATAGSEEAVQLGGLAKQAGALGTTFKILGKAAGVVTAYNAWSEAVEKGGAGRYTKAVAETALIFIKTNPIISVALALGDLTGLTDKLFDW